MAIDSMENYGRWHEPSKEVDSPVYRILLAEDDYMLYHMFIQMLTAMGGHTVFHVDNGKSALEAINSGDFDVLVTDNFMPEMNGEEVVPLARELNPDLRIIMVSAATDIDDIKPLIEQGLLDRFLPKPCTNRDLLESIKEVMANDQIEP